MWLDVSSSPAPYQMRLARTDTVAFGNDELDTTAYNDKYVVVYNFRGLDREPAVQELTNLINDLKSVGLHTEVRAGYGYSVLVFVQAPQDLLGNRVYRSRVKDWLYGITKQHPGGRKDSVVKGAFEAEEVLAMLHLVNWQKELGGAGIYPEFGKWKHVDSIFPLHNARANQALLRHLSKKIFLHNEDLDEIRDLWGPKVAFYFAFLQTYFLSLAFPCVAGLLAWQLLPKFSLMFALIIGIWCVVFLEYWKIQEIDLSIRWQVRGVRGLKTNRPQYTYEKEIIDVAGRVQQYFPKWKQITRQLVVVPFVGLSALLLGVIIVAVFAVEIFISEAYEGPYRFYLEYLPTVLLAVFLPYIGNFLEYLAAAMTEFENHRTEDHHEMSLTQKIFVLNFITNYLPIFLTAFVYVPFGHVLVPHLRLTLHQILGTPVNENFVFKGDPDRLRNEVIALTVTGQLSNMWEELIFPYLKNWFKAWWHDHQSRQSQVGSYDDDDDPSEQKLLRRARKQALLPKYNVQEDISEMVIQFGYLALFSPVWPLVPIGFFINNWVELRSDFIKICVDHQRPAPERSDGIGPWINSLEVLTWLGSLTSAAIVHLFGTHNYAMGLAQNTMGRWLSLPITVFISEHLFLAFRAGVRFALHKIGSEQMRRERSEQYAERKKYLDELENNVAKSGHLNVAERERRKSIRMTSADLFWRRQVEESASAEVGAALIRALTTDKEENAAETRKKLD